MTSEWVQALAAGDGSFAYTRGTFVGTAGRMQLVVGDFNNDRKDDVLL